MAGEVEECAVLWAGLGEPDQRIPNLRQLGRRLRSIREEAHLIAETWRKSATCSASRRVYWRFRMFGFS